jgi:LemA protein
MRPNRELHAKCRELNQAEAQLGGTLGGLFALSEAYPGLKANHRLRDAIVAP